jgi:hypothetical protein
VLTMLTVLTQKRVLCASIQFSGKHDCSHRPRYWQCRAHPVTIQPMPNVLAGVSVRGQRATSAQR